MPLCPFNDLPERVRQENNWLLRNYHGIEWFDGEANSNISRYNYAKLHGKHVTYIPKGKKKLVIYANYSRNVYNLEEISLPFKELPDGKEDGQHYTHHGFRAKAKFLCALRNAYKLKHWLVQNSGNSSYDSSVMKIAAAMRAKRNQAA